MSEHKKNLLSATEICEIIKQCGLSGVSQLTFNGLSVKLGLPHIEHSRPDEVHQGTAPVSQQHQPSQTREAVIEDQLRQTERELDQLLINDPLEYERQIRSGDLVDEAT
jgi:hypothetical protein